MSAKHTPGLLHVDPKRSLRIATDQDESLASTGTSDVLRDSWEANARRLVACWNACEMVSTEDLEALTRPGDVSWAGTIDRLVRERDELLEALKRIVDWDDVGLALTQDHVVQARAAIAKVEGGAA